MRNSYHNTSFNFQNSYVLNAATSRKNLLAIFSTVLTCHFILKPFHLCYSE